jgi:hypothetical protein
MTLHVDRQETVESWGTPVSIRIGTGPAEFIHNAQEGLDYLRERWPAIEGPHKLEAKKECEAALSRKADPKHARNAFIAAAIEADIFL